MAKGTDTNEVIVMGEYINSIANEVFIVLQGGYGFPDVFVRLLPENSCTSTINSVPPSIYILYLYDLNEDGLPNRSPVYTLSYNVTVSGEGEGLVLNMGINSIPVSFCCRSHL